jgi:hypothetical protein
VNWRLVGAILLATWPLSTPAFADVRQDANLIQFSYQWGRVEQTFTDASVTVTVTNNITNKIGWNGEVIDTYRITLGSQVIEVTEKHDARAYTFEINGTQTLVLEGIDNGYWGGFYGPIMQIESVPLAPVIAPVTESPTLSAEPQTQSSESPASGSAVTEPQPQPQPTPEPIAQPTSEPSPSPAPSQPEPTPTPEPSPEPTASLPTKSPEPEQTQSPTLSEPIPTPTSTQSESEPVVPETTSPEPQVLPTIVPSPQSSEEPSEEPTSPATQAPEVTEETESATVSGTIETAVTEAIGAALEAVGELVEVFASAGLDMTAEQREEAQAVVVSTVMTSQVAVGMRKIK